MRAAVGILALAFVLVPGASASHADTNLSQVIPLVVPAAGNATLVHVTFALRNPPAGATPHVFVTHPEQLAKSMLVVGAAKIGRTDSSVTYDALLGLLRRRGGPADSTGGRGLALGFRVSGTSTADVASFSHDTVPTVLPIGGPAAFCRAVTAIADAPSTTGVVGATVPDAAALAKATAALCSGKPGTINAELAKIGPGRLAVPAPVAAALRILRPQREKGLDGQVAVFADPRRLPTGTRITEALTLRKVATLTRAGRLFWVDYGHTILTPHASRLLVLDARTLRPLLNKPMVAHPFVNGAPPTFLRTTDAYVRAPDAVYLRLGPNGEPGLVQYSPVRRVYHLDFKDDAVVTIGDRHDSQFDTSFKEIEKVFDKDHLNIPTTAVDLKDVPKGGTASTLLKQTIANVAKTKKDIFLFIAGHGYAEHDSFYTDQNGNKIKNDITSKTPQIQLDSKTHESLGGPSLEGIIKANPKVTFKVVIESCFSGRFMEILKAQPNVAIAVTSAPKNEPSHTGFDWSFYTGLQAWATAAGGPAPPTLVGGIQAAYANINLHKGNDHPQIYVRGGAQPAIDEDDTWAHNPPIKKSNVCINIRTKPAQAQYTATLTGPGGFRATTDGKQALKDGAAQFVGTITQAGEFTKTITVYDATGNATATVTHTFLVADPPTDGPKTTPPCRRPDK